MKRAVRLLCLTIGPTVFPSVGAGAQIATQADTTLLRRVQFGASLAEVPDSLQRHGVPSGAYVLSVIEGSSAAAAGVRPGDVLVALARDSVRNVADALGALRPLAAGRDVPLTIVRDVRRWSFVFRTRERPRESSREFVVEYRAVAAQGGKHRVLVTHPPDGVPHPAVLIIGGIGCYSIDQATGGNNYRDLAYHLTRHGYTVVRVEKLGVGDSEGGPCLGNDFETELDGYRATLKAISRYSSVDTNRVFLFGHSIGGVEAPLIAGEHSTVGKIAGVAVLSTTGVAWYEYELANLRRQLRLQDLPPDSVEGEMQLKTSCGFALLEQKQSRATIIAREPRCAPFVVYPASDEYMQTVSAYPPAKAWRNVHAPALVMYGTSDFITSQAEHLMLAQDIDAMHPGAATYADIPELDHYLSRQASQRASIRDSTPGLSRAYYGATLEPVLDRWLDSLSRPRRAGPQ